jgi:hypothetical protein
MAVQSIQIGGQRTELPPLGVIGIICIVLIMLNAPAKRSERALAAGAQAH